MANENKMTSVSQIYEGFCNVLDEIEWKYTKKEEEKRIIFFVESDVGTLGFNILVDEKKSLIRILSFLPNKIDDYRMLDIAVAICIINYGLADGAFSLDLDENSVDFAMNASFDNSVIGKELLKYMLNCVVNTVDKHAKEIDDINKQKISIADFLKAND